MFDQVIEFVINNYVLVGIWAAFVLAFLWDGQQKSGKTVTVTEATRLINKEEAVVLDIRDHKEYSEGHIANAVNIPYSKLATRLDELNKSKSHPIVLVCKSGQTVGMAGKMLREKGFNAVRLQGGMMEWHNQNLPVVRK